MPSRVRSLMLALLALLYVASWPGAALRPLELELAAPPIPKEITERDGVLDVVVTAADGAKGPIAGARVKAFAILDGRASSAGEAVTDATGRARLEGLPRAEHWIVAEAPGRARASQMVVIVSGARRLDLALGPEHTLDVQVKTEQGQGIAGAEIEVRSSDPFPVGGRTTADGTTRVGRLGEGPYIVTVRAQGYEEITRRRVPEGQPFVVTLGKQGALLVKVLGEDGQPAAGARVLMASPTLWPARVAETGKDGTVRIGGLDPGSYTLRSVKNTQISPIEVGVAVARGEEKSVELHLAQGVSVAVRVVDAVDDEGVAHARVSLAEGGLSPFPIEGVTDKNGRVVLGPIARGSATVSVSADGFVAKGAMRVEEPVPPEVKVALVRGGTLIGKVVDSRGWAVDGATIRVVGTDLEGMPIDEDPQRASFREAHFTATLAGPSPLIPSGELGVMPGPVPRIPHGGPSLLSMAGGTTQVPAGEPWVTGRDGTFRATPVPPGRVRALVRHPQYVEALSEIVQLASEKEAHVEIVLSRGGSLEGKVVDVRGRSVAGAQVTVLATRGSLERTTRTGTDGSFAFAAVPEALTVLVARDDDITQVVARVEVAVPEGGRKTVEITLPEPREPLPVRVTADRGKPVEAAQVSAVSLDPSDGLRVTSFTNARGECTLTGGKGLALRVEVRSPGRAVRVVTTTADTQLLDIALLAAESVTGQIWANRRETIEGADVVLQTETGTRRARTNKDGAFTIADVPAGPAKLRVRAKGRAPLAKDVTIEDRGGRNPTDLGQLELGEEAIVEGVVVDPHGDPVAGARVAKDAVPTYLPVGAIPSGMAVCDPRGRFHLAGLGEGNVTLEAYAPDFGRARATVRALAGRTTDGVKIVLARADSASGGGEPLATGGVAVTLGETAAGLEGPEVVVVAVSEGSEAERAGLAVGDVVLEIGSAKVRSIADARARLAGPVHDDVIVKLKRSERVFSLRIAREAVRR
jgi:protocatechuate 3,4-dioxygenase beta subunit